MADYPVTIWPRHKPMPTWLVLQRYIHERNPVTRHVYGVILIRRCWPHLLEEK